MRRPALIISILWCLIFAAGYPLFFAQEPFDNSSEGGDVLEEEFGTDSDRKKVAKVEFLGEATLQGGYTFKNTVVGGLSGMTYNPKTNRYYLITDDPSEKRQARYYTVKIDIEDGVLSDGDVIFRKVTKLTSKKKQPYPSSVMNPEAITVSPYGTIYISSKGDTKTKGLPFIGKFNKYGRRLSSFNIHSKYLPATNPPSGIRENYGFESLALSPNNRYLYAATENALFQDSPRADLTNESLSRVIQYDRKTKKRLHEFVYIVDKVEKEPVPSDAFCENGLVELVSLDNNGTLIALERAYSKGVGYAVRLYEANTQGALDVRNYDNLFWEEENIPFEIDPPISKRQLVDLAEFGITPSNFEGMTLGPVLPDGRQVLMVVSDNQFHTAQSTHLIALALTTDTIPVAMPALETPRSIDADNVKSSLKGDSDDPAIWVHPENPDKSLVIATQKTGGLTVFSLSGKIRQKIKANSPDAIRFNNVDLIYNFTLSEKKVDLAVVSDRTNDTLAIFKINPETRRLKDVTSSAIPATIFGVDDGERTAYGLATYNSIVDDKAYAFVTQADGNLVAQLELFDDGNGRVNATESRMLELPIPTGDPEDSQSEGVVADRQLGALYVAMEEEVGILKFSAEPDGGNEYKVIHPIDADFIEPDIEGLTIYYGPGESGYLMVSSQGDSTIALLDRGGDNKYLGSFAIGEKKVGGKKRVIDQVNESDGFDVLNVSLGSRYPSGLLVVQDGANDTQHVVPDDEELENRSTNFKFVPWESVAGIFSTPLIIDTTSYHPRKKKTIPFPGKMWDTDTPEKHGLDSAILQNAAAWAEGEDSDSLLIIRDGYLVFESYWNGLGNTSPQIVWSVSKSFTSALVGIAEYQGHLNIEDMASGYIEEWTDTKSDGVAIKHLLSNNSGRKYDFTGDYWPLADPKGSLAPNLTRYAINRGQDHEPGTFWVYNNMAIQCLDRVLETATGDKTTAFGEENLLKPLGMSHTTFGKDDKGQMIMPSGIYSTARDMARLGYLYLHKGNWNGKQILAKEYVAAAISPSSDLNGAYGYLWWLNTDKRWRNPEVEKGAEQYELPYPDAPLDLFVAAGLNGQYIIVSPSENMIIVRQGHKEVTGTDFVNSLYREVAAAMIK